MAEKREPAIAWLKNGEYGQYFVVTAKVVEALKTIKEGDLVSINKLREPTQYGAVATLSRKPGKPKVESQPVSDTDEF